MADEHAIAYVGEEHVGEITDAIDGDRFDVTAHPVSGSDSLLGDLADDGTGLDCIVCEHDPPGLRGVQFLERASQRVEDAPAVLVTADGSESLASKAVSADLDEYVDVGSDRYSHEAAATVIEEQATSRDDGDDAGIRPETPYRAFVEDNISGVYEIRDEEFTYVNHAFADIFGYDREELVGTSPFEVIVQREHQILRTHMQQLAAGDAESVHVQHSGVRKDGEEVVVEACGQLVQSDPAPIYQGFAREVTDQKRRERRFEAIFNNTYQFTGLLDLDGTILEANDSSLSFVGLDRDEVVGEHVLELGILESTERARTTVQAGVERARAGEAFREELRIEGLDRELYLDFTVRPVTDRHGDVSLLIVEAHDITDRREREKRTAGLREMLAGLMDVESKRRLGRIVVEAAERCLNYPVAVVVLASGEGDELTSMARSCPAAAHLAADEELLEAGGPVQDAFVSGEPVTVGASSTALLDDEAPVERLSVNPLGRHGVIVLGSDRPDEDFEQTVTEDVRRSLDRIEREELLQARETALAEQNERLDRLNRINQVIRQIDQVLVGSSTRAEIEEAVCEKLVEMNVSEFAWIGGHDSTGQIRPRECAGPERGYLDAVSFRTTETSDDPPPAERAVQTREPVVIDPVLTDPPRVTWREEALRRDFQSVIAIPLEYRDSLYGVLTVVAAETGVFDELARDVLVELGETIAHAINAAETRKALVSDALVEVELHVGVLDSPLLELLDADGDREMEFEGVVPTDEGQFRVFYTVHGADSEDVSTFAERTVSIRDNEVIAERDDACRAECTVTEDSLVFWLLDRGAVPRSISITSRGGQLAVSLSDDTDVREFVDQFAEEYPDTELQSVRECERPATIRQNFRSRVEDHLTSRQREILQTAYLSGYFETPRERSGSDVADSIGIVPSTFSAHVRAGTRNLLELLYEDDEDPSAPLSR